METSGAGGPPTPSPDAPAAAAPPSGAPATPPSAPGIAWWEHVVLTPMLLVHGALGGGEAAAPTNENYTPPKRADAVGQVLNVVALHITVRGAAKGLPILSRAAFDQLKRIANSGARSGVRAAAKQAVKQEARAATSTAPSAAPANEFPALGDCPCDRRSAQRSRFRPDDSRPQVGCSHLKRTRANFFLVAEWRDRQPVVSQYAYCEWRIYDLATVCWD